MKGLEVLRPGMLSLVEDRGRFGYGEIGITRSGAADAYSAALANRLLRNPLDAPLLEVSMGGVELLSHVETEIALTGGEAPLEIGGRPAELWRTHRLSPGETFRIGMLRRGLRLYLAVAGGFEAPRWLGSASVSLRDRLGEPLKRGDLLACREFEPLPRSRRVPRRLIPDFPDPLLLRLLPGAQAQELGAERMERLFASEYRVSNATDRMGCRLEGEPIPHDLEILSEPIAYGAVQIPRDGQPIVLLNERQTIGGYPKAGAVLPADCHRLAQARPGSRIRFRPVTLEEARETQRSLRRLLEEPAEILHPKDRKERQESPEGSGEEE
ncbi:5-oxoprolinase subunit C family protein [Nitratifractor sp.]